MFHPPWLDFEIRLCSLIRLRESSISLLKGTLNSALYSKFQTPQFRPFMSIPHPHSSEREQKRTGKDTESTPFARHCIDIL